MFSTSRRYHNYIEGYHEYIGGYHEYIGGYHEYIGGYHEYIGGCSVHQRYHDACGQYIKGIMMDVGSKVIKPFNLYIKPLCTEHRLAYSRYPPHASWYPPHASSYPPMHWTTPSPDVVMISPHASWYSLMYWTSLDVLVVSSHMHHDIPWCTHGIPCCNEHLIMQVSISSVTNTPPPAPPRTRRDGSKNPSPRRIIVYKNPPLGTEKALKAPPSGHKVREFHKHIYELWHYLKWKALWTQQMKRFFNEETDY